MWWQSQFFRCCLSYLLPVKARSAWLLAMTQPTIILLINAYLVIQTPVIETPRGGVRILREDTKLIIRRVAGLAVGTTVFYYPYAPLLPFLTARGYPSKLDKFVPNHTT